MADHRELLAELHAARTRVEAALAEALHTQARQAALRGAWREVLTDAAALFAWLAVLATTLLLVLVHP